MTILQMSVLNLVPEDSDRESDGTRSISLHLADSDMGSDMEAIFKHMKGRNGSTSCLSLNEETWFSK